MTWHVYAQQDWTLIFQDDFEDGNSEGWYWLDDWSIVQDNSFVLKGEGSDKVAKPLISLLSNYSVEFQFRLEQNRFFFDFRNYNPDMFLDHKYSILFGQDKLTLLKDGDAIFTKSATIDPNTWYDLKGIAIDNKLTFKLDGQTIFEYQDEYNPYLYGRFAFRLDANTLVKIDNIKVMSEYLAQEAKWIKTGGPSGGLGYDIRIHPDDKNMMFVTDNPSGLNKSVDGGRTWESKNSGISTREGLTYDGIPVFSASIDPSQTNIIWIGMQNIRGIYKSTDYGETWERKVNGIQEEILTVRGIGIHPENSDILLIGTEIEDVDIGTRFGGLPRTEGKIYKTVDGGDNWYQVWNGGNLVRFVLYDYSDPNILYASTGIFDRDAVPSDSMGVGVLKSTDGGETWERKNNGLENLWIGYLEMHPEDPKTLYAAAGFKDVNIQGGIYKTTDGAETWTPILKDDETFVFTGVTVSPSNPNVIYAGSSDAIFRSDDGGQTWNKYFYYQDTESGKTNWGPPGVLTGFPIGMVVDPDDPMTLFINNYGGGNFKSTDGARTWQPASKGYTGAQILDLNIDKLNPLIVYATGESGPFRSLDGGQSWTGIYNGPIRSTLGKQSIGVHPHKSNEVLIGCQRPGLIAKSTDYGDTWKVVFKVDTNDHAIRNIEYAPSDPNIVYAITTYEDWHAVEPRTGISSYGVLKSTNAGESWEYVNTGLESTSKCVMAIAVCPQDADIAFIAINEYGIYKTTDGGSSWQAVNNGLGSLNVRCLTYHPHNVDVVYAGLSNGTGIFRTTNGGEQWSPINDGLELSCAGYLNPIGKGGGFSFKTPEWYRKQMLKGSGYRTYVPWAYISSIAIDPANPSRLYASDYYFGVYYSVDEGASWRPFNEGLQQRVIYNVEISGDGKVLYAGSSGNGAYRMTLQNYAPHIHSTVPATAEPIEMTIGDSLQFSVNAYDLNADSLSYRWLLNDQLIPDVQSYFYTLRTESMPFGEYHLTSWISDQVDSVNVSWHIELGEASGVSREQSAMPDRLTLYQAYPNPFNNSTKIRYYLPKPDQVSLVIYNVIGQKTNVLIDEYQPAGMHAVTWAPHDLPTGTYLCQLKVGDRTKTQKIVIQK